MIIPNGIIYRYIFKEMILPFVICVVFFQFVFLMTQLLEIINYIVNYQVDAADIFWMLVYSMPFSLLFVLPMATMMAILLTFIRMTNDNEVVALQGGGVSIYNVIPPVLFFCALAWLAAFIVTAKAIPWGSTSLKNLTIQLAESNFEIGIKEHTFNDQFDNIIFYVNGMDPKTRQLTQVFIEDQRKEGVVATVVAPAGQIFSDPENHQSHIRLFNGTLNQVNFKTRAVNTINFKTYDITMKFKQSDLSAQKNRKLRKEMTFADLRTYFATQKQKTTYFYVLQLEYYKRYALPVACFPLGLISLALGFQGHSRKKSWGLGLALFFFILYYVILTAGRALGEDGTYPPILGMWMPNLIMGSIAIFMTVQAARGNTLGMDSLKQLWQWKDRVLRSSGS